MRSKRVGDMSCRVQGSKGKRLGVGVRVEVKVRIRVRVQVRVRVRVRVRVKGLRSHRLQSALSAGGDKRRAFVPLNHVAISSELQKTFNDLHLTPCIQTYI